MGLNGIGGEGYKPAKAPDAEQAPDPVVSQLASVAKAFEARTAQIEPGELNPEDAKELKRTIHAVIDKE